MRIAEINMIHFGSTGKIMLGIAEVTRKGGHEVWTFSPRYYAQNQSASWPAIKGHTYFGTVSENKWHHHFAKITGFHGCFSRKGTRELLHDLDAIKPDIIHLHNLHNWTMNFPMLFSYIKKNNIQTVWTLHDCWPFTGHCPHFTMVKCDKWKTGCYSCPQYREYPQCIVDNSKLVWRMNKGWFTGIKNMTIVTPSQWLADLVKQSFLKDYPIKVIHNGIDLSVFKPVSSDFRMKHGIRDDQFLLLGVAAGWGKRKGLDVFTDLSQKMDSDKFRIVLVGTNDELDKLLSGNIISVHQTQNQRELAEIYTAADLFVNPTREENYPTVNMEAIACGTPVLTFRTGGSPEIPNATCGAVVDCDDVDAMEREIIRICETKPFSKEACLKRSMAFDMNKCFKEYVDLFEISQNS